ncbi:MAG: hypothetical protein WCO00_06660 [Rhodospirillaceae bacterium]
MIRAPTALLALALAVLLPVSAAAVDPRHIGESRPQSQRATAAPQSKPKTKPKADENKNCQWGHDVVIEIEYKRFTVSQDELKKVISGLESTINGYTIFANPKRLVLYIRSPEGYWFSSSLMRIGSLDEGCLFYYVGTPIQLPDEPPL